MAGVTCKCPVGQFPFRDPVSNCATFALVVLQRHRFQVYWLGQTLSGFGDAFALVALPLLVLEATHSVAGMGLVSAAGVGAQVVTSLFSGNVVDRLDRRKLMLACDTGRACVYGIVPIVWWLVGPSLPLLFAIVILGGAMSNVFSVAYMTAVPSLVSQDRLTSANARLQGSLALAYVFGSLGAGYLATAFGSVVALLIDAATFLISAISLTLIRFDANVRPVEHGAERDYFGAGMRFLLRHRLLRAMTVMLVILGLSGNMGVGAGITDLMIFYVKRELALEANKVGLCVGLSALGAVLGAVLAPRVSRRFGSGSCFLSGSFVQAAGLLLIGALHHFVAACIGGLLWGAGMLLRGVPMHTLRQSLIPRDLLGRVTAISWMVIFGASAMGTAAVTRLAASWTAGTTLSGIGVGVAIIAAAALLSPIASESSKLGKHTLPSSIKTKN